MCLADWTLIFRLQSLGARSMAAIVRPSSTRFSSIPSCPSFLCSTCKAWRPSARIINIGMDLTELAPVSLRRMRRLWVPAFLALTSGHAFAASDLYENNGTVVSPPAIAPQIDARVWVNRSIFNIFSTTGLPYESQNTLFFTNTVSGRMTFDPGVRFVRNVSGGQRLSMDTWINEGRIGTDHDSFFFGGIFFLDSRASLLQ